MKEYKTFSFEVKKDAIDNDGKLTIEGYASTFGNEDNHNDVMVAGCFDKWLSNLKNVKSFKLLLQHDHHEPGGYWTNAFVDGKGLKVRGKVYQEAKTDAGISYHTLIQDGVVDSLSIGFYTKDSYIEKGIRYITEAELIETSLVTIPANKQALLTGFKSHSERLEAIKNINSIQTRDKFFKMIGLTHQEIEAFNRSSRLPEKESVRDMYLKSAFEINGFPYEAFQKACNYLEIEPCEKSMYNTMIGTEALVSNQVESLDSEKTEYVNLDELKVAEDAIQKLKEQEEEFDKFKNKLGL